MKKKNGIDFRDPSPKGTGVRTVWVEVLEPLKEHINRWAYIGECKSAAAAASRAAYLRRGARLPKGKWEFAARGNEVFARFLGEP